MSKTKSLPLYFIIAFLIPIIATTIITLKDGLASNLAATDISSLTLIVIIAMVHAPAIAALIAAYREQGFIGIKNLFIQLRHWKFAPRWYLISLFIFPTIIMITLLLLSLISSNYAPVLNLSVLALASLASTFWEELGWTGYATPRMLSTSSPLKVGLVLGLIHAMWHLPANFWGSSVFHGELYLISFLIVSAGIVVLRVVTVWIYVRTKSLVLGWFAHIGFTTGQLLLVSLSLTSKETVIWQTAFMVSLFIVLFFILIKNKDFLKNVD